MNNLHWTVKRRLQPFENIFQEMRINTFRLVSIMDEGERKKIENGLSKLSNSNCSWMLFAMREHIADAIEFYRNRDEEIQYLSQLENDFEKETDRDIRIDIQRAIDTTLKKIKTMGSVTD